MTAISVNVNVKCVDVDNDMISEAKRGKVRGGREEGFAGRERMVWVRTVEERETGLGVVGQKNPLEDASYECEVRNEMEMHIAKKRIKKQSELLEKWREHLVGCPKKTAAGMVPTMKEGIQFYGHFSPDSKVTLLDKIKNKSEKQVSPFSNIIEEEELGPAELCFSKLMSKESSYFKNPNIVLFNDRKKLEKSKLDCQVNYDGILRVNVELEASLLFEMVTVENFVQYFYEKIFKLRRQDIISLPHIMNNGVHLFDTHKFTAKEIQDFVSGESQLEFYFPASSESQQPRSKFMSASPDRVSSKHYESSPPLLLLNSLLRISPELSILSFAVWNSLGRVIWQKRITVKEPLSTLSEIVEITEKGVLFLKTVKIDYRSQDVIVEMN